MARHAQPRELADLKGAAVKNPQRYRNEVPKSALPLGEPPGRMSDDGKACWFEISSFALEGVLAGADRFILEITSNLWAEYIADPVGFQGQKYTHMIGCFARMGFSPSDRTKLGVENKRDDEADFVDL